MLLYWPHVLGNLSHVLVYWPHVLGNCSHVLVYWPHVLGNWFHVISLIQLTNLDFWVFSFLSWSATRGLKI